MLVSFNWLQTFFKDRLPEAKKLAEKITFSSFEVEGMEEKSDDTIFDIKVLADRACYALSHQGVARELAAVLPQNEFTARDVAFKAESETEMPQVKVEDTVLCRRYVVAKVINLENDSPAWLKKNLEAVSSKSINLAVDLANFVMLDIGQPMHVFDAEKVIGAIHVRKLSKGEKIELLDGKEIELPEGVLVIADEKGPLAIAGIRGGKRAEVSLHTKSIIIESASFDAASIRQTSGKIGIRTDASKRFENNLTSEKALDGMTYFLKLLKKERDQVLISPIGDQYFQKEEERMLEVSFGKIQFILGAEIENATIVEILNSAGLISQMAGENVAVRIPPERKDINIAEDVAEEVGRIWGLDKIPSKVPEIKDLYRPNKNITVQNMVRNFLFENGFSEIITYSLGEQGEVKMQNPLASDKGALRTNLSDAMEEKLVFNLRNSDFLGSDKIRIFEIGKVFGKDREWNSLAVGIAYKKVKKDERPNDEIKDVRDDLLKYLGIEAQILCTIDDTGGIVSHNGKQIGVTNNKDGILELDLDYVVSVMPEEKDVALEIKSDIKKYQPVSVYPFIVRDVAVFVPGENKEAELLELIKKHAGDLLVKTMLFDVFTKTDKDTGEKKTSYGYRLIFQSFERTLTEAEINDQMKKVTDALNANSGWQVR